VSAQAAELEPRLRERLRAVADALIPAAHGMPAASEVGIADDQLDRVLAVRPDLLQPLRRALPEVDPERLHDTLDRLALQDARAHEALLMAVAGGYYANARVRGLLGFDGQQPVEVRPEVVPTYVEEGLIDPVLERGPRYRQVPERSSQA
jgi:hypothetical protein